MIRFTIFVLSVFLVHSQAAFPDDLPKCALKDEECMRKLYEKIVESIGEKGIPELGIPPIDPIELKNVTVSQLSLMNITLVKGVATGIRSCVFDKFTIDLVNGSGEQENTCSIKVDGKYKMRSISPLISNIFGISSIHGEGNGKASLDKVHLKFNFPIYAQKRADGEIYMKCDYKKIAYEFEVQGGAKFFADNIYFGDQEVSKEIIPIMNENWKFVISTFGKAFMDKAMEFYFDFASKFFDVVPARYFIKDDLTPYARP